MNTFLDVVRSRVERDPNRRAFTFLTDGKNDESALTYEALDRRARSIAVTLRRVSEPGARALVACPPGLDYIAGWLGCLYARVVAVPAYPAGSGRYAGTLCSIVRDAAVAAVLATA